jgi:hypothetical protein
MALNFFCAVVALCFSMIALTMACLIIGLFLVGLSAVSG